MDPAQEIELTALARQKPMNDVIDRGDSNVQQFYAGATVFMTGGSGFIGKQLIEKLFRSCSLEKMYLLMRTKKSKTVQERANYMFKNPVYDKLREKLPQFQDKIILVEGDVADIRLGLSEEDFDTLTKEVNIIFHVAATIRFEEPLRKATFINLRGTREILELARNCKNLKKLVHVSTAFSFATCDRQGKEIKEQVYPCPILPDTMISLAETLDENRLNNMTKDLIKGWPNTYTFTKCLAEELIRTKSGDLPVCIVRPPLVLAAYCEPAPGWTDKSTITGPTGIVLGVGVGVLRVFRTDVNSTVYFAPVDYVNNTIIAAAWDSTERQKSGYTDIPIYSISKLMRYGIVGETLRKERKRIATPKAVWRSDMIEVKNKFLYIILFWFYLYIPGYILDCVCFIIGKKPKGLTSFVDLYRQFDKMAKVYDYFLTTKYDFKQDNVMAMMNRMSDSDKAIYNFNIADIDLEHYILVWGIGIRKYILKDGLQGTDKAYTKFKFFLVLDYIVTALYIYALWWICSSFFSLIKNMIF